MAKKKLDWWQELGTNLTAPVGNLARGVMRGLAPGMAKSHDIDKAYKRSLTDYYKGRSSVSGGPDDELQTLMAVMRNEDAAPEFKEAAARRVTQLPRFREAFSGVGGSNLMQEGGQSLEQELQMFNRLAANSTVFDSETGGVKTSKQGEYYKKREAEIVESLKARSKKTGDSSLGGVSGGFGGRFGGLPSLPDTRQRHLSRKSPQPFVGPPAPKPQQERVSLTKQSPRPRPPVLSKPYVVDRYPAPQNKTEFDNTLASITDEREKDRWFELHYKPEYGQK